MTFTPKERDVLKKAHDQQALPDAPESLRQSVLDLAIMNKNQASESATPQRSLWAKNFTMAACLVAGIAGGVLFGKYGLDAFGDAAPNTAVAVNRAEQLNDIHHEWVIRVADYQSLYTEKTVANVSPTRQQDALQLLAAINQQTPTKTAIPNLSEFGYTFARAQQLGFDGTPLVQLVYAKPGFAPLAFCYMSGKTDKVLDRELALANVHGLGTASWINAGQHYVLVADEPEDQLTKIHQSIVGVF